MLTEYPRPQFVRDNWTNLNGDWNFAFDDARKGEREKWYEDFPMGITIQVPYAYECKMSTIADETHHPVVWYQRMVTVADLKKRTLLNFEGVDYSAKVWVNGACVGTHEGGYAAFTFDITDYVKAGENSITVRVEDSKSCIQPRGKQRWKDENYACWYVQTTGIWKSVWMEQVSETYLKKVKITPNIDEGTIEVEAKICGTYCNKEQNLICEISFEGNKIRKQTVSVTGEYVHFTMNVSNANTPWSVALWSPRNPKLYDITFTIMEDAAVCDEVSSYFGMRKISIEGNRILLNNLPLYQRMILDQGYWKESHLTPPSEDAIIKDIDLILKAGFNGLRKHQKVEDPRFLYWCDKKGLLVWSEMAAQYLFNDDAMTAFSKEWLEIVEQNYNHPCIITWTVFNESWGIGEIKTSKKQQKFTEGMYHLTKAFDPMRPVIVNDGWEHTVSDIITLHDYMENGDSLYRHYSEEKEKILKNEIPFNRARYAFADGYEYKGQPVIISEYGGIAFNSESGWGYGNQVKTEEEFEKRYEGVTCAIQNLDYVSGFCYTQLTDVQQEINGLYASDRTPKVSIEKISEINQRRK